MKVYQVTYPCTGGVDLSVDPSLVAPHRSPWMPNLYPDEGGILQKRPGWRVLHRLEGPILALYRGFLPGGPVFLAHAGTRIYAWSGEETPQVIRDNVTAGRGCCFTFGGRIYLLTGGEYLYYDGEACGPVSDIAYVPCTVTDRDPAGGGTALEAVNLLTPWRRNRFLPDGESKTYQLDAAGITEGTVSVWREGRQITDGWTADCALGSIRFDTAPEKPAVAGQSVLEIRFQKPVPGYAGRVERCTAAAVYGDGAPDTLFFTGNPDWKNRDFYSGVNDPTYFPDLNYGIVGSESSAVMGYAKVGQYLAVIKQDDAGDSTIYLREPAGTADGRVLYALRQGVTGVGAAAARSFASLQDEPLFLSRQGVYAIVSSPLTGERSVQSRSRFIDRHLTAQPGLEQACAAVWRGFYLLCAGNTLYLLDGRSRTSVPGGSAYESYHFTDLPACCLLAAEEDLYFGTDSGDICRLNTDLEGMARFEDYTEPGMAGPRAVVCSYATKNDDDGEPVRRKTLLRRGCAVTLTPFARSSGRVAWRRDGGDEQQVLRDTVDRFDWTDLDFSRFTFSGAEGPRALYPLGGARNYLRLQILVRSDGEYEGFGVAGITKSYIKGGHAKG